MTVGVRFTKWGGTPHWTFDCDRLGADEHGVWIGAGPGLVMRRPGVENVLGCRSVLLVPRDQPWTAAFYPPEAKPEVGCEVYIDMATPAVWDGDTVSMVDLDLDVLRLWDGSVIVDDEDEFAEHQVALAYPADIVALAERSCAGRLAALRAGREPFDTVFRTWLERV